MRFLFWLFIVCPLWLILSCTSSSKKDLRDDTDQQVWLQTYQKAVQTNSCELFSQLVQQERFILRQLSILRARIVCSDTASLPILDDDFGKKFPYLQTLNNERILKEAERGKDAMALSRALRSKALASDRSKEKLTLLQKALELTSSVPEEISYKEDLQNRIYAVAPRLKPDPKTDDYLKVAADHIYNRDFANGREFLKKIFENENLSLEERLQGRKLYRNSFKTEQNRDQYVIEAESLTLWLQRLYKRRKIQDGRPLHEAYMTWARAAWTQGQTTRASEVLILAEKKLKKISQLEEIYFTRGRMLEETGHWEEALASFTQAATEAKERSPLRDRILFSQAWMLRKLGRFVEAAATLDTLIEKTQDPFESNRYTFWLARSLAQAGKSAEAKKTLEKLKEADGLGYYGLLAYRELNEELPFLASTASSSPAWMVLDRETRNMISALLMAQETEVLEKYLNEKTASIKNFSGNMDSYSETWFAYLKAYAAAGLYLPLFSQLGTMDPGVKAQLLKQNPDLLFPRKFMELINPSAEKFGVRPELILSIIRQESAFNPLARSSADAFGLMQLLPGVAKDQQSKTGIQLSHYEDLYEPAVNIPVGAALLSQLQKKYRGQFILTAAAYNASEKAIEGWLKTRLRDDPLEFIEDIPYDETRTYVKLVLRNFIFYSRLADPLKRLSFPSWCLEDLQTFKVSTN